MRTILIISTTYSQSQHIKSLLARHAEQFQVLGTADNSVLGMSLIESSRPDIVIMPVLMNFWNAEDLIHSLLPRGISPQFVLLRDGDEPAPSGAAAAQVAALLQSLLPSEDELLRALNDAARQLDRQRSKPASQPIYHPAISHSLEVTELLMGLTPPGLGVAQMEFGRLLVGREDCWMLLCAPSAASFNFFAQFGCLEAILEPLHRLLEPYGRSEICVYRESNLCILLAGGQAEEPDWDAICRSIQALLKPFGVPELVYFEISDMPLPLERWHGQCRELLSLREKRFFFSPPFLQPKLVRAYQSPVSQAQLLDQLSAVSLAVQDRKRAELADTMDKLERMVRHSLSRDLFSFVSMQLILLYSRLRYGAGFQDGGITNSLQFPSAEEAFRFFRDLFFRLYDELDELRGTVNPIVSEACGYISRYLSEELTLDILAKEVHVSPTYLSRLFKRETGSTVNTYISRHRIQRAIQLLETPRKITEIAGMVGFDNAKYFSQVFRKYTGKTPQQYRQMLRKEETP